MDAVANDQRMMCSQDGLGMGSTPVGRFSTQTVRRVGTTIERKHRKQPDERNGERQDSILPLPAVSVQSFSDPSNVVGRESSP